jgi:LacI family transcriptional regulator
LYSLTEFAPLESAYQLVRNKLRAGSLLGPAMLCTTAPGALGAMRAFYEAGVKVGHDISLCAVNDEGIGPYLVPSLTSLQSPPRVVYLRQALDWMLSDDEWQGPLLIQPRESEVPLFAGESTGPIPAEAAVRLGKAG